MATRGKEEICYLAGIIDGEGSMGLYFSKRKDARMAEYRSVLTVANTDLRLMVWIKERFGGTIKIGRQETIRTKTLYNWYLSSPLKQKEVLELVEPYLIVKKKQCELLLCYFKTKRRIAARGSMIHKLEEKQFRESVSQAIKELNRKKTPPAETERGGSQKWEMLQSELQRRKVAEKLQAELPLSE